MLHHAWLKKQVSTRKPLAANVLPADAAINCIATADAWLA
jgi:hypothetical protein